MVDTNLSTSPNSASLQEEFLEKLIAEKNYPQLDPEIKQQMKQDLAGRLQEYINAKLISQLSDKKVEELTEMLKSNPETDRVNSFFQENISDMSTFLAKEYLNFRALYLGLK